METQDSFAPYAPVENVLRVLNKARAGALRGVIDTNYLIQLGINDSMAPRAIRALVELDWVTGQVLAADGGVSLWSPIDPAEGLGK